MGEHVHKSMGTLFGAPVTDVSDCPELGCHMKFDMSEDTVTIAADALAKAVEGLGMKIEENGVSMTQFGMDTVGPCLAALAEYRKARGQ
jgi:hypothetical protein